MYREHRRGHVKRHKVDYSLRYAYLSWCTYAVGLVAKVCLSAKTFLTVLQHLEECDVHEALGVNVFIMTLCGSCVVFFLIAFRFVAFQYCLYTPKFGDLTDECTFRCRCKDFTMDMFEAS